jgi:hypothetical protein
MRDAVLLPGLRARSRAKGLALMCTVAAVIAFLGYMPPRGTVITVPKSAITQYTPRQIARAQACASKHGILWRIE